MRKKAFFLTVKKPFSRIIIWGIRSDKKSKEGTATL
jgi:hypothetical protein